MDQFYEIKIFEINFLRTKKLMNFQKKIQLLQFGNRTDPEQYKVF